MSEEFMQKMFMPFTQEDGSNTSEYGGSGLGLAISKSYAEAMGGTIKVESFRGVGSTFTVELPLGRLNTETQIQLPEKQNKPDARTMPIIAMTANALDEDRQKTKEAGLNAHLSKPYEPVQLCRVLATFIKQNS